MQKNHGKQNTEILSVPKELNSGVIPFKINLNLLCLTLDVLCTKPP